MTPELRNRALDLELHAALLQRALGRGGASVDADRAREVLPDVRAALDNIERLLGEGPS
jgi:hypothetical protein